MPPVLLAALAACNGNSNGPEPTFHPAGVIAGTTSLDARPFGIAISVNGTLAVAQVDANTVARGLLPDTLLPTPVMVGATPTNVAFSKDGGRLYVTNQGSHTVGTISLSSNTQVRTVLLPEDPFNLIVAGAENEVLVTGNGTYIYLVDATGATLQDSVNVGAVSNGITRNRRGTRVYVSLVTSGKVVEIDPTARTVLRTFLTGGTPQDLAVSPDGKTLFVADETGAVQVWSLTSGTSLPTIPLASGAFGLALSPDGEQLYVGRPASGAVDIVDVAARSVIRSIATGGTPRHIGFDVSGKTAVIANEAGFVTFVR